MSPEQKLESQDDKKEFKEGETSGTEKSEVDVLKEKVEKLEAENKKIREEKLETKTSPAYFEGLREQKRKEREARILNTKLPREYQVTEAQIENMTTKELAAFLNEREQRMFETITRDKIVPMVEQEREDTAELSLQELSKKDPEWRMYLKDMVAISKSDPSITADDCYMAALAKNKDWKRLEKFRSTIEGGLSWQATAKLRTEATKMAEEKEPKKESTEPRPKDFGQRPGVSISGVKRPSKGMTVHEAAKKAYEEVFEQGKGG